MNELAFINHSVVPFDYGDGKIWFTGEQLAELLGYADSKKISNIYNRHKDEFTESMTCILKVRKNGINNSLRDMSMRLFSPCGAHLIGMVSRTKVAKDRRDKRKRPPASARRYDLSLGLAASICFTVSMWASFQVRGLLCPQYARKKMA
ncbi:hypothetical protein [Pantoea septica]|uniref:hypothetical protein n=1 Tax=Pantoea septica TaxID=472695 RepID=UPI0028A0C8DE|nr:hypothetical protein [Pantoea septica]